jgi:phytoene dehydrogenase-like protein
VSFKLSTRPTPRESPGTFLGDFLDSRLRPGRARLFIDAFVRLLTFAPHPEILDAGAALRQIRLGLKGGVLYVDRGWDTLVRGLETKAVSLGVVIHTASPVDRLPKDTDGVLLAIPPEQVTRLTGLETACP